MSHLASTYPRRKMLTIPTFAARLNVSRRHVYNLIEKGKVLAFRFGGNKALRIPEEEVERFLASAQVE